MVKPVSILVTGFGVSAFSLHQRIRRVFTTCWRLGVSDMSDQEGRDGQFSGQAAQQRLAQASSVNDGSNRPLHLNRSSLMFNPFIVF